MKGEKGGEEVFALVYELLWVLEKEKERKKEKKERNKEEEEEKEREEIN